MAKITFILPTLNFSGGVKQVQTHCAELNRMGHDCQIWFPLHKRRQLNLPQYCHTYLWKEDIPDADVVIATANETAFIVAGLSDQCGQKYYFVQHYEQWYAWDHPEDPKYDPIVDASYLLDLCPIFVSRFIRDKIAARLYNQELEYGGGHVVHNGVPKKTTLDYFVEDPREGILFPYRSLRWKGYETMKVAIEMFHEDYPKYPVHSFGFERPKDLPEFVTYHRGLTDTELGRLMDRSAIFVNPSWIEGFGLPNLEAASHACAVISTTSTAMPEMFRTTEMCFVPPRDSLEIYHALKHFVSKPETISKYGMKAWEKSWNYTMTRSALDFEKAIGA